MTANRIAKLLRKFVLIALVAALCSCALPALSGCGSATSTTIGQGEIQGKAASNGMVAFKGIPYATPPVGELRYKPPLPPKRWMGTFEAFDYGKAAPQPADELEGISKSVQSEDCLTLNIWTPGVDDSRRPVMVWIHGGGWTSGSSRVPVYDGAALAKRGDVVVVTANYRLGPLGFLYLGGLGGQDYAQSGNLGLLDQTAALKWVGANISRFGGDPKKITIFGESAGSMSVCSLMGMPAAKGLFRRAIAESGALNTIRSTDYAYSVTQRFMQKAGVTDLAGLKALSWQQIVQAETALMKEEFQSSTLFGPVIDGSVLPQPPLHAIAAGSASGVDLMNGTNLDEVRAWTLQIPGLDTLSLKTVLPFFPMLQSVMVPSVDAVEASYKSRRPDATEGDITMAVGTDVLFRVPAIRVAEAQSAKQPGTWMYLFTWPSPVNKHLGSCHSIELPFVFGNLSAPNVKKYIGDDPPQELADIMQDTWTAFARTGNPNNESVPSWKAYDDKTRATMILNVQPSSKNDPYSEDRQVWDGIPFDSVNPSL
jgi:para-nitrobenzyl esterase